MRFFSNDAREAPDDDPDHRAADEQHPDRVQSEPVAVPGPRPPSPWATPAEASAPAAVPAEDHHRDDTQVIDDPERTQAYEPGPVAETVESPSETNTTTYAASIAGDRPEAHHDDVVDVPLDDTDTTEEPKGGNDVTDRVLKDEGGFEDPQAIDPATARPLETRAHDEQAIPGEQPPVVPVPVPAAQPEQQQAPDTLFAANDATALKERWRDVQLRFVDSPKEATEEAAKLVEEAVDQLTASLKSRKDGLGGASDDTETLRVQLRGYRDILNRITGL
ncbi:hypothetical protein [Actinoplanes sp. TFC3]|uniref:hypothetical protein n=1 Tax=Actinoplanes sp. TFC3 TaxID=1710355 RepID=UPI000A737C5E|nr:hypothetical protein [Actinoplanes sp. TFC3]